jgi:flagellar biosynthesis protein FlhF
MQIKKFKAKNFSKALEDVKKELGENALILNTRSLTGNGSSSSNGVEVTVAVDHPEDNEDFKEIIERAEAKIAPLRQESQIIEPKVEPLANVEPIAKETDAELKSLLFTLLSQTDRAKALGLKDHQIELYKKVIDNGVSERIAAKVFEKINTEAITGKQSDRISDNISVRELLAKIVKCGGPIKLNPGYPKVVALVGPTGVGKTTTIAKLAADFSIKQKKKVALITLDTYRIGAADQLKVYGDIMRIPVEVASNAREYRKLLHKFSDMDIIFVDTMGKSHKDPTYASRLNEVLRKSGPVEIHLTLSASLQERVLEEAFNQFSSLKINKVLFTKLDEGLTFGSLINLALHTQLPFSYFTDGQRVPEDIETASKDKVIRLIFNLNQDKVGV